jgi:hypothetical protein
MVKKQIHASFPGRADVEIARLKMLISALQKQAALIS